MLPNEAMRDAAYTAASLTHRQGTYLRSHVVGWKSPVHRHGHVAADSALTSFTEATADATGLSERTVLQKRSPAIEPTRRLDVLDRACVRLRHRVLESH